MFLRSKKLQGTAEYAPKTLQILSAIFVQSVSQFNGLGILHGRLNKTDHAFWPDTVSLTDEEFFDQRFILSPKQITDTYLLGLAAYHQGRLVTFDSGIVIPSVRKATSGNLVVL